MKSRNEHIITEDEFKTLDTESISQILLKNGKVLKLKSNNEMNSNNNNLKTCTCHKKNKIRNFIIKNINYNKEFYVTPVPNVKPKLLAIKIPLYEEQKKIRYDIKTFTFEVSPKKYKYKPYKSPQRRHISIIKSNGFKYNNTSFCSQCNKNKECICMQYCTCKKFKNN
jgi:hypothetical protein